MEEQAGSFPETIWTKIRAAQEGKTTGFNSFVDKYREPVRKFLRRCGASEADSEDLAQEVFLKIYEHRLLERADKAKGRFRNYIYAITKNILMNWNKRKHAAKRGGENPHISLDQPSGDTEGGSLADIIVKEEKNVDFDALWMETILQNAMMRLKEESENKKLPYFRAYSLFLSSSDHSYKTIADAMRVNENQVKHYLQRAKKRIIAYVKTEIRKYCSSPEEYEDEIRYLPEFISK